MDFRTDVASRAIIGVMGLQNRLNFGHRADPDQGRPDGGMIGMTGRVLDAELAHHHGRAFFTVGLLTESVVFTDHLGLFGECRWRRHRFAPPKCIDLTKDPRIADRTARDRHPVDTGLIDHPQAIIGGEQVATAEDQPLRADVAFDFGQKRPTAGTDIALLDGPAVNRDGGDTERERAIEDPEKVVASFGGIVDPAAHLDRHRAVSRDGIAGPSDDFERHLGLREMKTATAATEHLFHGTAEVDVDDIEPGSGQFDRAGGELFGFTAHQLPTYRAFLRRYFQEMSGLGAIGQLDQKLVQHHLTERVSGAVSTGEYPHRQVAVTTQCGLKKWAGDRHVTDFQRSPPVGDGNAMARFREWVVPPSELRRKPSALGRRTVIVSVAARYFRLIHADTPKYKSGKAMQIQSVPFGQTPDGEPVALFTLTNHRGHSVRLTNYGAVLMDVNVADAAGKIDNVNLSFDSLPPYLDRHPHFGSTIGRFCNRIGHGQFTIDGGSYQVTKNLGKHHLHGGTIGFDHLLWQAEIYNDGDVAGVRFELVSPDAMEGFPGTLKATADYSFSNDDELSMTFSATTDAPTHVNLCNHSYWNLGGAGSGLATDTVLTIEADEVLDVDADLIPTGRINSVDGSGLDFRQATPLAERLDQFAATKGYDHCFVIRGNAGELRLAARAEHPGSGRVMEVWTTQPAMQLYTGNHLPGNALSGGYGAHEAFCLETQHHPDAPNHPHFPSTLLRPGETYSQRTVHRFLTR